MKFRNLIVLVSLLALSVLLSCSKDEGDDNEIFDPASEYYIQFKANGKLKTYEADDVPFNGGGEMASCNIPPDQDEFAGITITNRSFERLTATEIEGLANTTLMVESTEPHPIFFFLGKNFYASDEGENPSLTMTITTVEFVGTRQILDHPEQRLYKVTGTFSGKVTNFESGKKLTITAGRFVMGFTEG
jgi:hypothetical protein